MSIFVEEFFIRTYERSINKQMLYYSYKFPTEEVLAYVRKIINLPIEEILEAMSKFEDSEPISPKDIFQFSSFADATTTICELLKEKDNPGITWKDAGILLLNDGKQRKDGALIKYGENHLKTAESLGLLYELTKVYFLSCIGFVFGLLTEEERQKLLLRLVLRNKLVRRLYVVSQEGTIDMRQFFYMVSDSTYTRRTSNVKAVLKVLEVSDEYDFSAFLSRIYFRPVKQQRKTIK
jgi:hypothetical protein